MFIGHFAVGFGAKALQPKVSLGSLFLAVQFPDLLWPTLLLLDWEQVVIQPGITAVTPLDFTSYPISHSLLMVLGWSVLLAFLYWLIRRRTAAALLVGACVLSHWLLDVIVHRPDLPLYPGNGPKVGLGLWYSLPGTLIIEAALFFTGVALYVKSTRPINKKGLYGFWTLVAFLFIVYLTNLFGPIPPSILVIAWAGQFQWLVVLWAWWVDHHRVPAIKQRTAGYYPA